MRTKYFTLAELFDTERWQYGRDKQYRTRTDVPTSSSSIPVISGQTVNNGIRFYTDDTLKPEEAFSDCLTISTRGYSGTPLYHDGVFALANNVLVMPTNMSRNVQLYIAAGIAKLPYGDAYSNYPTKDTLKEDLISLPVKTKFIPDWSEIRSLSLSLVGRGMGCRYE